MPNRQKFAEQYALTGNGVQSAIAAGYSAKSAHVAASRLLRIDKVAAAIDRERERIREKADLDAGLVLDGLLTIARDEDNAPAARVSAYRSLGDFLNLWHRPSAIDEMARGFLEYLAGTSKTVVETQAKVVDSGSSG